VYVGIQLWYSEIQTPAEEFLWKNRNQRQAGFFATIYLLGFAEICAAEAIRNIESAD